MKILLLSVGKPRDRESIALHDRYAERIRRFGVEYETVWVPDTPFDDGRYSEDHVRNREGRKLLDRRPAQGKLVALDRRGNPWSSEEVAARLETWATPRATLVLGGPFGLDRAVLDEAHARWSLSTLTLPHELARVVVGEQIYRALTILRRVPYHK